MQDKRFPASEYVLSKILLSQIPPPTNFTGGCSEADYHLRNSVTGDSIGGSYGVAGPRARRTARPCDGEVLDLRSAPAKEFGRCGVWSKLPELRKCNIGAQNRQEGGSRWIPGHAMPRIPRWERLERAADLGSRSAETNSRARHQDPQFKLLALGTRRGHRR
jgi:hypothetical protein